MSPIEGGTVQPMDPLTEALSSLPPQSLRTPFAGDGVEPSGTPQAPDPTQQTPPPPTIQEADAVTKFRTLDYLSRGQDRLRLNRNAVDLYHTWRDANVPFGRLEKLPNQNKWIAKLAPGIESPAAVPNKAADLCNKVTDTLLADPPQPNPQPRREDEVTDRAAELVSIFLKQNAGESGINEVQQYRWALRNALTRATSYLEYDVDPEAGGYQPKQVQAHPLAQDGNNPLVGPDGMQTDSPVLRYVSASGQFVTDPSQADKVWLPKIVVRKHMRTKVMLFPPLATIETAEALLLVDWCSLAEARKRWPDTVGQMSGDELQGLASWRPQYVGLPGFIVPFTFNGILNESGTGPGMDQVGSWSPLLQRRMYFYRFVVRKSMEYPQGYQLDITGRSGGIVLGERNLEYTVQMPEGGSETRCRDIQFVQITPIQDISDLDPTGYPFAARFDGSTQAEATLMSHYLDALDRMARPHVFLRSTTAIDEDEWQDRTVPHVIGPSDQAPFYEQFPPLPPIVEVSEHLQVRQDTASGLTATAQGLDSSNAVSGVAKKLTVRQAQISLAGIQQQLHSAFTRGWRITCQWAQSDFTTPQLVQATGDEASEDVQWWTGEDFAGIDEIGIEPGTGTMMTAEDKANYVSFLQGQNWIAPDKAADIGVIGIARDLGLPTDSVKAAIERAVALWLKGPPQAAPTAPPNPQTGQPTQWIDTYKVWKQAQVQFQQAQAQYQQKQQQYQQWLQLSAVAAGGPPQPTLGPEGQNETAMRDYQTAVFQLRAMQTQQMQQGQQPQGPQLVGAPFTMQPPVAPQPPQVPAPWSPFTPRPNDTEPMIAAQWFKRLSLLQMSPSYSKQIPEWRDMADQRYTQARQAVATASGAVPGQQPGAATPPASPQSAYGVQPGHSQPGATPTRGTPTPPKPNPAQAA